MAKGITIKELEGELGSALDKLHQRDADNDYHNIYQVITEGYESLGYSVESDVDSVMWVYYHDEDIDEEHNEGYVSLKRIDLLKDKELLNALDDIRERRLFAKKQRG